MDWSRYPNFSEDEFKCSHSGKCAMDTGFMDKLQALRSELAEAMTVTSGYRDTSHPVEASKGRPGTHTRGIAVDIACDGQQAYRIMALAMKHGFTGIGVSQSGGGRFLHLDTFTGGPRPNIWSY